MTRYPQYLVRAPLLDQPVHVAALCTPFAALYALFAVAGEPLQFALLTLSERHA